MTANGSKNVVRMHEAAVGYDEHPAIRDVDFSLERGEIVALLGPNGAGKSTLVRGILGLAPLMSGTLHLFGVPAREFGERYRIGYVPQRHTIVGGVPSTVREVVSSGRLARKRPFALMTSRDRAAVTSAIDTVGLGERADVSVGKLSGGQQRRVLTARALAAEPDVLVMDEPTAGVDAATQEILAATLGRLVAGGTTLLLVAHELGPLEPLIQRVVVMRAGRIADDRPLVPGREAAHHPVHHHLDADSPRASMGLTGRMP